MVLPPFCFFFNLLQFSFFYDIIRLKGGNRVTIFQFDDRTLSVTYKLDKDPSHVNTDVHIHDSYELYCYISGDARYMIEGREVLLESGTLLLIPPGELHHSVLDSMKPYERYGMLFKPEAIPEELRDSLLEPFRHNPTGTLNVYHPSAFSDITPKDLYSVMCTQGGDDGLRVHSMLIGILSLLQTAKPSTAYSSKTNSVGIQMVDYVNRNLRNSIGIKDVANEFFLSVSQAARIFKQATGVTVHEYIARKRLLRARRKILLGVPAQKVAQDYGFGSYTSFYRLYRKTFGMSPGAKIQIPESEREFHHDKV